MRSCLIICAGSTIKTHKQKIDNFIAKERPMLVGVNNVTHLYRIHYHLWTNWKRFRQCYDFKCKNLILGSNLVDNINENNYMGKLDNCKIQEFKDDIKKYRTAGIAAIDFFDGLDYIIYVVGMDGYSLIHGGNQHCYGKGTTDCDMTTAYQKDCSMYSSMKNLGVDFKIITPTVFESFYQKGIL